MTSTFASHASTADMIDALLQVLEVPAVGHPEASAWRAAGLADFEDALQVACARAGSADVIVTRNVKDCKETRPLYRKEPGSLQSVRPFTLRRHHEAV